MAAILLRGGKNISNGSRSLLGAVKSHTTKDTKLREGLLFHQIFLRETSCPSWSNSALMLDRGLGKELGNLQYFITTEIQIARAHHPLGLLGVARSHDCARDRRILQRPCDCHLSRRTSVMFCDLLHALHQRKIPRKIGLVKIRMPLAPIVFG